MTFIIPNYLWIHLYKFMYLYFLIGYYIQNFIKKLKSLPVLKYCTTFLIISTVFLLVLKHYSYNSFIYTSKYYIFGSNNTPYVQLNIDIYRSIIGLIGSLFIIFIINLLDYKFKKMNLVKLKEGIIYLGKNSLGIYIISTYLFLILSELICINSPSYINNLLETFIMLIISISVLNFINKNDLFI